MTCAMPDAFDTPIPIGRLMVAVRAEPPSPVEEHVPVPRKACTTPPAVMRRTTQPLKSATNTLPSSGSTASAYGW